MNIASIKASINWDSWQLSKDGETFGRLGVYIEDSNNSRASSETIEATLNIYVFFETEGVAITSKTHILKKNGKTLDVLPIDTNNEEKISLIYFENIKIEKTIQEFALNWKFTLDKVQGFYTSFEILTSNYFWFNNKEYQDVIINALKSYKIFFSGIEYIKYRGIDFKILSSELNKLLQLEGQKIVSLNCEPSDIEGTFEDDVDYWSLDLSKEYIEIYSTLDKYLLKGQITINIKYENIYGSLILKNEFKEEDEVIANYKGEQLNPPNEVSGYIFRGWSYSSSILSEVITKASVSSEDQILYAIWEPVSDKVTLTFKEKNITENKILIVNSLYTLKNAEDMPTGKFLYWLSDEGKQYLPGSTITVTKNQTFTAVYDEREHTVIYMLSNGSEIARYNYIYGDQNALVEKYSVNDEEYSKWSTINNDTKYNYEFGDLLPNNDIILYSVKVTEYNIFYNYGLNYDKFLIDTVTLYNDQTFAKIKIKKCYAETEVDENGNIKYFQHWHDHGNMYLPFYIYNVPLEYAIDPGFYFAAVYGNEPRENHYVVIEENNGDLILVAENFQETEDIIAEDTIIEECYIFNENIKQWEIKENVLGRTYPFFNDGEIVAKDLIEENENLFDIENGTVSFNNFTQKPLMKDEYLIFTHGIPEESTGASETAKNKYLTFNEQQLAL